MKNALLLAMMLSACAGGMKTSQLSRQAYDAQKAGRYEDCLALATRAVEAGTAEMKTSMSDSVRGEALLSLAQAYQYRAMCGQSTGRAAAENEADFASGLDGSTKSLAYYAGLSDTAPGLMPARGGRIHNSRSRALCLKGLGRRTEAVAAMDEHIAHLNVECAEGNKFFCKQVADALETLSVWKKELSGGAK